MFNRMKGEKREKKEFRVGHFLYFSFPFSVYVLSTGNSKFDVAEFLLFSLFYFAFTLDCDLCVFVQTRSVFLDLINCF